jgi:uncharacterized protein
MFSTKWQTSPRKYGVTIDRDVAIPVREGVTLDSDIFRPSSPGTFPALLAVHAYPKATQSMEMMPIGFSYARGFIESGDFNFYVRRGYAFLIVNITGTHKSGGVFANLDPQSVQDVYAAVEWTARQPWCDGNVGMTGVSHFSRVAKRVAALNPPHLKAIFSPYGWTDMYRDCYYHGGILNHGWIGHWVRNNSPYFRTKNTLRGEWGEAKYVQAIEAALRDREISSVPYLADALRNPDVGGNSLVVDLIINSLSNDFYNARSVNFENTRVPAYFGGDWGIYGMHLPGDFRAFEKWKGPKKMSIGPPVYLDRPVYQYAYESLRWFDYWLKGMDTEIMNEPRVHLFVVGTDEWKTSEEWPLAETKWTPFYLHANGLLSEHEFWPNEGPTTYEDSPFHHGETQFKTPPMVEATEICGPMVLNLYGSTTDSEVLWFVSLWHTDARGRETLLTRGWLRGSQRALDLEASTPWQPIHVHTHREPLEPNRIYEFNIEIRPYAIMLRAGERIGIKIKSADDEVPRDSLEAVGIGHVFRRTGSHVTIHHGSDHPSHLLLPITKGNRIGTYISGGKLPPI